MHPAQKSLDLFKELIEIHSNPGDVVCDPFLGSGTTVYAAKQTERLFRGCEIDSRFFSEIDV